MKRFEQLSESDKESLLKLIDCDTNLSFTLEQLESGDIDSLAYFAQMSHQGTLVIAPYATRALWLMMDPEGKTNLNAINEKINRYTDISDCSKSDVIFS